MPTQPCHDVSGLLANALRACTRHGLLLRSGYAVTSKLVGNVGLDEFRRCDVAVTTNGVAGSHLGYSSPVQRRGVLRMIRNAASAIAFFGWPSLRLTKPRLSSASR